MLESELKNLWKSSAEDFQVNVERLTKAYSVEKSWDRMDKAIYWRNIREYVASCIVAIGMAYYILFLHLPLLSKLGCALLFVWSFVYTYQIWKTRNHKKKPSIELPLVQELMEIKNYLEKEAKALKMVFPRILLPGLLFMTLYYAGLSNMLTKKPIWWWGGTIGTSLLLVLIWWMNQFVVKKKYNPLLKELDNLITSWEN